MYIIAGLGNPGSQYSETRHNIGFSVLEKIARELGFNFTYSSKFSSEKAIFDISGRKTLFVRPMTYMNRSGQAVSDCIRYYRVIPEHLLIIHDDLDLPIGRIKAVRGGGPGGHNGILSIIEHLSENQIPRLKIGIGRPRHAELIENFVIKPFYEDEKEAVSQSLTLAATASIMFVTDGIEMVMNRFNSSSSPHNRSNHSFCGNSE